MDFLLGLPTPSRGPVLDAARDMGAPVLLSCNAFSRWRSDGRGGRDWIGFNHRAAANLDGMDAALDSAGFVAAVRYRGWPWPVDAYLDLAAAHPWRWFASMDWCVEPQVAANDNEVQDRISGTIRLNRECWRGSRDRGIEDRLMPVVQGWEPHHYLRCLDGLPRVGPLIGVGSMCRRHMLGHVGVLAVLDRLDRALPPETRLHLFGVKSDAARELAQHPRVASVDSQAYGVAARQRAMRSGTSKTNCFTAAVMRDWYGAQRAALNRSDRHARPVNGALDLAPPSSGDAFLARIERAAAELRALHEDGEVEWTDLNPLRALELAALDLDDDEDEASQDCDLAA